MNRRSRLGLGALLAVPLAAAAAGARAAREPANPGGYVKTGWLVHAGYYFHDTMFYGSGRGGPHAAVARVFPLFKRVGLWAEAGCIFSSGTLDLVAADAETYRTHFDTRVAYLAAGPSFAHWPIPFGLALYFHRTALEDLGLTGPLTGVALQGRESGPGLGIIVNILGILGDRAGKEGVWVRATVGYAGFIDSTQPDVETSSALGQTATFRKWKPFRGECLRAGVELDF